MPVLNSIHRVLYNCKFKCDLFICWSCVVKPEIQKGVQWRKVASRGDGTSTAELVCRAESIPRADFTWEKNGALMDFANPR